MELLFVLMLQVEMELLSEPLRLLTLLLVLLDGLLPMEPVVLLISEASLSVGLMVEEG
jgi:hypothetical protein